MGGPSAGSRQAGWQAGKGKLKGPARHAQFVLQIDDPWVGAPDQSPYPPSFGGQDDDEFDGATHATALVRRRECCATVAERMAGQVSVPT